MLRLLVAAHAALALVGTHANAQPEAPSAERFVDPVSAYSASISPSGAYVAYIARTDTDRRLMIVDVATRTARVIQTLQESLGAFDWVRWKSDDRLIVSVSMRQELHGRAGTGSIIRGNNFAYDINRIFALNRDGSGLVQMFEGQMRQLYYGRGSTFLVDTLRNDPSHVLISAWDLAGVGVWRGDIATGSVEQVMSGSEWTADYTTDGNGTPVIREEWLPDGSGYRIYRRAPEARNWTLVREARRAAVATNSPDFQVLAPGPGAAQVYVLARQEGQESLRLFLFNTATGDFAAPLDSEDGAEVQGAWFSPQTHEILATCDYGQRYRCTALDAGMRRNFDALDRFFGGQGNITLIDMSDDATKWLLHFDAPTLPDGFYLYDTSIHDVLPIASAFPNIDADALSPTSIENYTARDGTRLWAYVTAHPGATGPRPTIILPHGGPESRDVYGYDPFVQFLASRGYVVVQPNFRGGSGFGRSFADAGRGQWGLRMQDDVTDAVHHMISAGAADPERICIVGGSYGGYAALQGAASTPELYRCAVSVAGPTDLLEMLMIEGQAGRGRWNYQYWLRSIGDPSANRAALEAASPRRSVERISAPVLLIHGDEDESVPYRQSEQMQRALNSAGKNTRLVRIRGEGHGWNDWSRENRLTLYRETEEFLAQHLNH